MKIDCSKLSNKDDLLTIIAVVVVTAILGFTIYLAAYQNSFIAGFFSATVTWKWHEWIYSPIDNWLEKIWAD
jgi:uncharacterized membrane protein